MQAGTSTLLEADEAYRLTSGELIVESGLVWLTESGRPSDLFLRPGQRYRVGSSRKPIVQALTGGTHVRFIPASAILNVPEALRALAAALASLFKDRLNLASHY